MDSHFWESGLSGHPERVFRIPGGPPSSDATSGDPTPPFPAVRRILLIEDDPGAQLLYRNRLSDLGHQVVVSSTGAMGLMEARSGPFDLFLVDIDLGTGIDGYEVCRRLKTIPEIHAVPVVLISGHVKAQEDLHRGYEAGCQSFLVKGDLMLLEDVVRAMLRIKSLQDDLAMQNRLLEDHHRRLETEKSQGGDERAPLAGSTAGGASAGPDGILLVDDEGVVHTSNRGARDLLGHAIDKKHLARLAPDSRLEAVVRNARTDPLESVRFEVPERSGRASRILHAIVHPLAPSTGPTQSGLRLVLLYDSSSQRQRAEGGGHADVGQAPLVEAARRVFRPSALHGSSAAVRDVRQKVTRLAEAEGPVLLRGPAGSGKSFVARVLHFSGPRPGPFVAVDCAAANEPEFERALFGAARGADGGAQPGALQRAAGGDALPPRRGPAGRPPGTVGRSPRERAGTPRGLDGGRTRGRARGRRYPSPPGSGR